MGEAATWRTMGEATGTAKPCRATAGEKAMSDIRFLRVFSMLYWRRS
jgi:hypothetical protein